jgi:hypothetical protein
MPYRHGESRSRVRRQVVFPIEIGSDDVRVAVLVEVGRAESFIGLRTVGKYLPGATRHPLRHSGEFQSDCSPNCLAGKGELGAG